MKVDRREFVRLSSGALVASPVSRLGIGVLPAPVSSSNGTLKVQGPNYLWEYVSETDFFHLRDGKGRLIVSGKMQPAVVVAPGDDLKLRRCIPGKAAKPEVSTSSITFLYDGVNGNSRLAMTWRFDEHGMWTDPVVYNSSSSEEIVSLHYFPEVQGTAVGASLHSTYLVVPGISEGPSVSPIVRDSVHLDQSVWLGRGSFLPGLNQQWGLPVHYFCGFSIDQSEGAKNLFTSRRSESFVCGLADLPGGDLFLKLEEGQASPWINYRSDLWKHLQGPGKLSLGATLYWGVAPDYYRAIAGYYEGLRLAGIIRRHRNSAKKMAVALTPQYCTWGAQEARRKTGDLLEEASLREIYAELKASGMKAGLFSIDDKWEGSYGKLEHSERRLPHFEAFLDEVRKDGLKIGLWAALMRCERPADIGLTEENTLKQPDGKPYLVSSSGSHYYILDFTQPEVAKVLTELAKRFIRRYKPDLLKFDFGYELPAAGIAMPQDKNWAGERLMWKGLDIAIKAMREENPDLVVMYYNLSPLFLDYFDLHSSDDLFLAAGEYALEANRRFYFSSLMGPLGIPTYGSSGYDWASAPSIWFDSATVGTVGSLNYFKDDEEGESATPERVAKYNGITHLLRASDTFEVVPIGTVSQAPTLGAHARSWARYEAGKLVVMAYRPVPPGERNPLEATNPKLVGVISSPVPVIVASLTDDGIDQATRLGIVPYGGGEIALKRESGRNVELVYHYFGGKIIRKQTSIANNLRVVVEEQGVAPLEWIEVVIS